MPDWHAGFGPWDELAREAACAVSIGIVGSTPFAAALIDPSLRVPCFPVEAYQLL